MISLKSKIRRGHFILFMSLGLSAFSADTVPQSSPEKWEALSLAICQYVQDRGADKEQVEIEVSSVPKTAVGLMHAPLKVSCKRKGNISGQNIFTIAYQSDDGLWNSVQVLAVVRHFCQVVVLNIDKNRSDLILESDLRMERREVTWPGSEVPVSISEAIGKQAKRMLAKDRVLMRSMLEEIPMIKRGSPVSIEVHAKNLSITFPAVACEDGLLGERIRVKNKASGTYYRAEVKDARTVVYKY
jgi:flagella basal body P-ring formation protein FlgA